jgi:curved DNA-binding protein CbpA
MPVEPMLQPLLPYTPERDVYRLLGVPSSASTEEISAACRRLARTFHPDRNDSHRATAEMQVVNAVRQVMSDPRARAIYDRERYRFHAQRSVRPAASSPRREPPRAGAAVPLRAVAPVARGEGRSAVERYVTALFAGARAILQNLAPARCKGCRTVISGEDAYCAACGTPLLTGS